MLSEFKQSFKQSDDMSDLKLRPSKHAYYELGTIGRLWLRVCWFSRWLRGENYSAQARQLIIPSTWQRQRLQALCLLRLLVPPAPPSLTALPAPVFPLQAWRRWDATPAMSRRARSSSWWTPCTPWLTPCTGCTASSATATPAFAPVWPTSMARSCWAISGLSASTVSVATRWFNN